MTLRPPNSKTIKHSPKKATPSIHLNLIHLKQRILTSLTKLSDKDTYHIACTELTDIIQTLENNQQVSIFVNTLITIFSDSVNAKVAVKKQTLRLFGVLAATDRHRDAIVLHLGKIVKCIVERLKDGDSSVRETCCEVFRVLAEVYVGRGSESGKVVGIEVFVKPLMEAMRGGEEKGVHVGAAMCLGRVVECGEGAMGGRGKGMVFGKLCGRLGKVLGNEGFGGKAALLSVVANLAQIGAISSQSLPSLLSTIHKCLDSADWATRKAAADTLSALVTHSTHLVKEIASSTVNKLDSCRFDKVKPSRDSIIEAFQLWKNILEMRDASTLGGRSEFSRDEKASQPAYMVENSDPIRMNHSDIQSEDLKDKLSKKAPNLGDKEWNADFFQKLETQGSGDWPVEVAVPRIFINSTHEQAAEKVVQIDREGSNHSEDAIFDEGHKSAYVNCHNSERGSGRVFIKQQNIESFSREKLIEHNVCNGSFSKPRVNSGSLLTIQKQLSQVERQQGHLMAMLQDFMGGSQDNMVTLVNRVRGLERIVEDITRNLTVSSCRRENNFTVDFNSSFCRSLDMNNGYPSTNFWRSDAPDTRGTFSYGFSRNQRINSRRALGYTYRSANNVYQVRGSKVCDKEMGPTTLSEDPSARCVWQALKNEATLEAIWGIPKNDSGTTRSATLCGDYNRGRNANPLSISWNIAMNALRRSNMDTAFAEVLSTGDDQLLVQLMKLSGPILDQLSSKTAIELLHAIGRFLQEQNLFDITIHWTQQLVDLVKDNPGLFGIPMENKNELLLNLLEISLCEEGMSTVLMVQLALAWGIDLQQFKK